MLCLLSMPLVADSIWLQLEERALRPSVMSASTANAIVVLSGMTITVRGQDGPFIEWNDASDRFWAGLDLYRAGRAPLLVFTGGRMPWSRSRETEGDHLRNLLLSHGVPHDAVMVTPEVQNTADEAIAVAAMIPDREILLVTSAFHMSRAQALFQNKGFLVHPFPVDFRITERNITPMDFIPSAAGLERSSAALREWLGRGFYAIKSIFGS